MLSCFCTGLTSRGHGCSLVIGGLDSASGMCGVAASEHGDEVAYVGNWTHLSGLVGGAIDDGSKFLGTILRDDAVLDIAVGEATGVLAVSARDDAGIPGADGGSRVIGITVGCDTILDIAIGGEDEGVLDASANDDVGYPMSLVEDTRDTGVVGIAQEDLAVSVGGKPGDTAPGIVEICRVTHVDCADSAATPTPWAPHGEVTESEQQQAAPAGMETWRFTPPT